MAKQAMQNNIKSAVKWWKSPYFIDNNAGQFARELQFFYDIKIPDAKIKSKLSTNYKNLDYINIIDYIGFDDDRDYNSKVLKVLDKNRSGYAFSANDDNVEFVSPVNKKLYSFMTDGELYPVNSIYKFYLIDDYNEEYDKEDINEYWKELGIR